MNERITCEIVLKLGYLRRCEVHGYLVDNLAGDLCEDPQLHQIVDSMLAKGFEPRDRVAAITFLSTLLTRYPDQCPGCSQRGADDILGDLTEYMEENPEKSNPDDPHE